MAVDAKTVKKLRDRTGISMAKCKEALVATESDIEKAIEHLRKQGIQLAEKKAGRQTKDGAVCAYLHFNNKIGVMAEILCETDFVAKNEEFKQLGKDICMHITMANPKCVRREELSAEVLEREKAIYREQVKGKPENIVDKIINGKLDKFYAESCLLEQPFIKDDSITVGEMLKNMIAKMGENMEIKRFVRLEVGK